MLTFLTGLITGLLIGFCAGAAARRKIVKRQPARAAGKLSVKYFGPLDVAGTELSDDIVVHRTEAR